MKSGGIYDKLNKSGSTPIENTSRNVGAGKTPGVPGTVGDGTMKTQGEIGGGLGNTVNDKG